MPRKHRIPAPMWHRIHAMLDADPPRSYEAIARAVGTSWRVVAAVDRGGEREVDSPVVDAMAGVDVVELPDDAPARRCPGCGVLLRTRTCVACRDRDLLRGGLLRRILGGDAAHSPAIGLDLHGEDAERYHEVRRVRAEIRGEANTVAGERSAALAQLAEQREQRERAAAKTRSKRKSKSNRKQRGAA